MAADDKPKIPLPQLWTSHVRAAILHAIALAPCAAGFTRSWAANSLNARVRLRSENNRLHQEVMFLEAE